MDRWIGTVLILTASLGHSVKLSTTGKPCKQRLQAHHGGMAYVSPLIIGGQEVLSILDTGSFEIVVESRDCAHCPEATYNPRKSAKYIHTATQGHKPPVDEDMEADAELLSQAKTKEGQKAYSEISSAARLTKEKLKQITYGSGPVSVVPGSDSIGVPDCSLEADSMEIGEILDHKIPLLMMKGAFTAIVGMGPGMANESNKRLHHVVGSPRFSFCLPEDREKDGMIVWNDLDRSEDQLFTRLEVVGKMFWGIKMTGLKLSVDGQDELVGCEKGCGAILDTGTTLLSFDTTTTQQIQKVWSSLKDCTDLSKLPTMKFNFAGHDLELPPNAYVALTSDLENMTSDIMSGSRLPRLPMSNHMVKTFFDFNPRLRRDILRQNKDRVFSFLNSKNPGGLGDMIKQLTGGNTGGTGEMGAPGGGADDMIKQIMGGGDSDGGLEDLIKKILGGNGEGMEDIMSQMAGSIGPVGCELMLTPPMPLGETQFGPMVIIGMPFFRKYFTNFDTSQEPERSVYISKAAECNGPVKRSLLATESTSASVLKHVPDLATHREHAIGSATRISRQVAAMNGQF